jgi:aspartate ammonia-lyase
MDEVGVRIERDFLGELKLPGNPLWGIHTARARANFPLSGRSSHPELLHAYGVVKLACVLTNRELGGFEDPAAADALVTACEELAAGHLDAQICVDALAGGAGTSLNMNVNEVLANRSLEILGEPRGRYERLSPLGHVNRHQSTNDTFPTALRLAAIRLVRVLEAEVLALQESFQSAERRFSHVVKVGRTEMMDAVLTTLGRSMGAYAEALSRDRWRLYKCEERLRTVNLGGTAIGTGLGAPRAYIFRVVDVLRERSGVAFARAENLVEATQNADAFVEVSGLAKTLASNLWKIANDLRLMASGPEGGWSEVVLPPLQAGSSIMPGKVNPVAPEAVVQAAMRVFANDTAVGLAASAGNLELNAFLPLIADSLLDSLSLLAAACHLLREKCVDGIEANEARCRQMVQSSTATVTALLPRLGYEAAERVASLARESGQTVGQVVVAEALLSPEEFARAITPESVCRLGTPTEDLR